MTSAMRAASAIGLAALFGGDLATSAQPGERPKPHPDLRQRETRQPCPKQGPGFVRVPGSPTCIRLSGRAVGALDIDSHGTAPVTAGQLSIDTRSESEFGPVRAFVRMGHGRP